MSKMYFAEDGSYGDADGLVVIDVTPLTEHQLDRLSDEWVKDYQLPELANAMVKNGAHELEEVTDAYDDIWGMECVKCNEIMYRLFNR